MCSATAPSSPICGATSSPRRRSSSPRSRRRTEVTDMSAQPALRAAAGIKAPRLLRALLPALSLALVLVAIAWLNPRAISYFGFTLMLNLAIPIALATIAQMFVIAGNDLDLSIGSFVGFVGCVTATWLRDAPLLGAADARGLRRGLRRARRADLSAQPALDRGDARHELRLAGPCHPAAAETRRHGRPTGCWRSWASSRPWCRFRSWPRWSSPPSPMSA